MENFNIDSPVLASLNKTDRAFLDTSDSEIRKEIAWYLERVEYYHHHVETPGPCFDFGLYEEIPDEQTKFLYTFWFEAMIWYIRTQLKIAEEKQNKALTLPPK